MHFKRFAIASSIATLSGTDGYRHPSIQGLRILVADHWPTATQFAIAIVFMVAAKTWLTTAIPRKQTMSLISVGSSITAASLLWYFYTKLDVFIAGRLWNSTVLGILHRASSSGASACGQSHAVAAQDCNAVLCGTPRQPVRRRVLFPPHIQRWRTCLFGVFFGIASVAPDRCTANCSATDGHRALGLLFTVCLGMPFSSLIGLYSPILQATGHHALALSNTTLALVLFSVTFTVGALQGPLGLASAWAISFPILFLIITLRSAPRLGVRPTDVFMNIIAPLSAAALMLAANLIYWHFSPFNMQPAVMLATQIVLGAATYIFSLLLLDGKALKSAIAMVAGKRTKAA